MQRLIGTPPISKKQKHAHDQNPFISPTFFNSSNTMYLSDNQNSHRNIKKRWNPTHSRCSRMYENSVSSCPSITTLGILSIVFPDSRSSSNQVGND